MDIGLVGLAVMGENLALNIKDNGYNISVYNRTYSKTEEFMKTTGISGYKDLSDFIQSLKRPRKIILMVKSGLAVDLFLEQLKPHLNKDDIVIDCGNSFFKDTVTRVEKYKDIFHFAGAGISGGEEGARYGPSIMVGGNDYIWNNIKDIFSSIAAKYNGDTCCKLLGEGGAGHFVKMVHNGIEYGMMQILSEIYLILREMKNNDEISEIFEKWNEGKSKGYLVEICAKIFKTKDKNYYIDEIDDIAEQKGTGAWCSIISLELSLSLPIITSAVYARIISSQKNIREIYSERTNKNNYNKDENIIEKLESAYYMSMACCYYEGLMFIEDASKVYKWNINLLDVVSTWKNGCIIRTEYLNLLNDILKEEKPSSTYIKLLNENIEKLRDVTIYGIKRSLPMPSMMAVLSNSDGLRMERSGANLLQAMRDFFGSHMVTRNGSDKKEHLNWN